LQLEPDSDALGDILAEDNVVSDFVVQIAHGFGCVPHPELEHAFRAVRMVPQVRISEPPEHVIARLVCSSEGIEVSQSLQGWVQVSGKNIRLRKRVTLS
jgi:hypothetical protein